MHGCLLNLGWLRTALAGLRCQTCEGPCSEACAPGGRPEMADKACLCGNDSPGLTRSISIPRSGSDNSCITHLAMKGCKTQRTLSLPESGYSLWLIRAAPQAALPMQEQREEILNVGTYGTMFSVHSSLDVWFQRWDNLSNLV